jgi:hypothetical protein
VWFLGFSPIQILELNKRLSVYPEKEDANLLQRGFWEGFRLNYFGLRSRYESKILLSVIQNPEVAWQKVMSEVQCGRIAGSFQTRPISNLRCSPIGVCA